MATVYFIDSENVGDGWIDLLEKPDSKFFVFYTSHSPHIAYSNVVKLINATERPNFIECYEGNNGLDFQLVSYLGYELHINNTNEMIIVSNDTGFDVVVRFWLDREMNVKRFPISKDSNTRIKKTDEPVSDDEKTTDSSSVKVTEKISGVDKREIYTIINCIGVVDPSFIHLAFVHFYGSKNGLNIYNNMKNNNFEVPPVQWNMETKMKKLIEIIIKYSNVSNIKIPDSLTGFIVNNIVDDKNAMSNKLNKSFGESGPQLNKIFSVFYKTLANIKKKNK